MRTSEVAKRFSVHPNTVRLYEEWGYLPPIPRDASGQRAFTETHVEQMRLARHTLHHAPRSGPRFKEAYKEVVWLACDGDVQHAITRAHKHIAAVKLSREQARNAHAFLGGAIPENIAHLTDQPLHIHQAAAFIQESVPVLRRWESHGVIHVPRDPKNNYRIYGVGEIGWLLVVQSLRLAGYTIASCRRLINHYLKVNGTPKPHTCSQERLCETVEKCVLLFSEHEQHVHEVLGQLHQLRALR